MELGMDGRVLALKGPLDGRCTSEVRDAIYDNLSMHEGLVIDLTDVQWIDATALRMLAVATRYAEREGQYLTLRGCSPHIRRVLRHSPLSALLELESGASA
jgi:anti-anti-sigma factor